MYTQNSKTESRRSRSHQLSFEQKFQIEINLSYDSSEKGS